MANRINRLIQRERQQMSPKIKRTPSLDKKAIKMDKIPKTSKTFCIMKMSIVIPRTGLPQGIKKKERKQARSAEPNQYRP